MDDKFQPPVQIKVTIDHMRQDLIVAVQNHMHNMESIMLEQVEKAFEEFHFEAAFYVAARDTISSQVGQLVRETVSAAFLDESLREKVGKIVLEKMKGPEWQRLSNKEAHEEKS